ncbi:tetratricopeptide repeat protein [Agaribacter flavus]|uniref:Tetratricopeptide repeat protein n=1 Tax=Agaribacter flavus TaxID=1902781 RepID=A0ABV7FUJ7_9ALTE
MAENVVALTVENFKEVIVDNSQNKLVAVYFYAPWDESSMQMLPIVEAIASKNTEGLVLATVNCDEQQQITAQFGVRGLPTLMLVKEGQPIDGAAGPQDEAQLNELLDKHLPKPEEGLLQQADELIAQGDYNQAYTLAKQAFDLNSEVIGARFSLADCSIELGQVDAAKALLETVTMVDQDARYHTLIGKIELAEKAAESPELKELQAKLDADPENDEIKLQLAIQLQQAHKVEPALELLLSILKKDMSFGDAKKITLDTINALPDGEPLKSIYRRKVYSLLY